MKSALIQQHWEHEVVLIDDDLEKISYEIPEKRELKLESLIDNTWNSEWVFDDTQVNPVTGDKELFRRPKNRAERRAEQRKNKKK